MKKTKNKIRINLVVKVDHKLGDLVWVKLGKNKYSSATGGYTKQKAKVAKAKVISFHISANIKSSPKIKPTISYMLDVEKFGQHTFVPQNISLTKKDAENILTYWIY
jgi:hypothetical protein